VIGAMLPIGARAPEYGSKNNHGQEEEDPDDFEQDFAAHGAKRFEEARDTASYTTGGLTGGAAANYWRRKRARLCGRNRSLRVFAHDGLTGHPSSYAESDAQNAPD